MAAEDVVELVLGMVIADDDGDLAENDVNEEEEVGVDETVDVLVIAVE